MVVDHLKQIGKVKKLDKWVSHELIANFKKIIMSFSFILRNNKPFLNRIVACGKKLILYDNWQSPAQWLDQEEAPNHLH